MRERQRTWLVLLTAFSLQILAAIWLTFQALGQVTHWQETQDKQLQAAASQAAASIAREVQRMEHTASLLVQQQAPALHALHQNPQDLRLRRQVERQLHRVFDPSTRFNLIDADGVPRLPDPGKMLGPRCRADMLALARLDIHAGSGDETPLQVLHTPSMHPSPQGTRFARHFDLVVPEPGGGLFFIGVRAEGLQQLLQLHRQPGQQLALLSGENWRYEDLSADFTPTPTRENRKLTPEERAAVRARVPVEGTRWALAASLAPGVANDYREAVWRTQQRYWGAFTLVLALFSYLLVREIGRRARLSELNTSLRAEIGVRQRAEAELYALTRNDPLTGLANRIAAQDYLDNVLTTCQRTGTQAALLFFDLDHFKTINDSLGHAYGDRVLQEVAKRLKPLLRDGELFARWGGDEFLLVQPSVQGADDATRLAQLLLDAMRQSVTLAGQDVRATLSIGIALYPDCGHDGATLIRHADQALYHAKQGGRDGYQHFSAAMDVAVQRRLSREQAMRRAMSGREFELVFQPKLHLASGRASGAEALLRWRHPVEGLIPPSEFLPLLEESGMICQVGEWVVETACEVLAEWQANGLADQRLAINLSAREFARPDLVDFLSQKLTAAGVAPARMEIEITETCLMDHSDTSLDRLHELARRGFRLAIDDFGTGYSSLAYLRRFPVHALKIDQSFVRHMHDNVEDREIIRTIVTLAHTLDLTVVAEGVEHIAQNELLRGMGCDVAQGYLLSRPLSRRGIATWLARHS
jgi:diguanylate cyclase (GGDEF)-like protein